MLEMKASHKYLEVIQIEGEIYTDYRKAPKNKGTSTLFMRNEHFPYDRHIKVFVQEKEIYHRFISPLWGIEQINIYTAPGKLDEYFMIENIHTKDGVENKEVYVLNQRDVYNMNDIMDKGIKDNPLIPSIITDY